MLVGRVRVRVWRGVILRSGGEGIIGGRRDLLIGLWGNGEMRRVEVYGNEA